MEVNDSQNDLSTARIEHVKEMAVQQLHQEVGGQCPGESSRPEAGLPVEKAGGSSRDVYLHAANSLRYTPKFKLESEASVIAPLMSLSVKGSCRSFMQCTLTQWTSS